MSFASVLRNSVEVSRFPVEAVLRDGITKISVSRDGIVTTSTKNYRGAITCIARHDPLSPAFRSFLEFWAVVFAQLSGESLAFNQLIQDLISGRIEQDADCPYLFMDKSLRHGEIEGAHPLLKANSFGEITPFNPDDYYVNQAYSLEEDPRVKFYQVIHEYNDHDLPSGYAAGVTRHPGKLPEFNTGSLTDTREGILKHGGRQKSGHLMAKMPDLDFYGKEPPLPVDDFDDDIPL